MRAFNKKTGKLIVARSYEVSFRAYEHVDEDMWDPTDLGEFPVPDRDEMETKVTFFDEDANECDEDGLFLEDDEDEDETDSKE